MSRTVYSSVVGSAYIMRILQILRPSAWQVRYIYDLKTGFRTYFSHQWREGSVGTLIVPIRWNLVFRTKPLRNV